MATAVNKNILYQNSKALAATVSHAVRQQRFCKTAQVDVVHTAEETINTGHREVMQLLPLSKFVI